MLPTRKDHLAICHAIPGQTWPVETAWLYDRFAQSRVHAEIGVYCGRSLWATVGGMRPGTTVYAIDNGEFRDDPLHHPDRHWGRSVYSATLQAIQARRNGVTVIPIQNDSVRAAQDLARTGTRLDSVFIDGCHSYPRVLADIECLRPLIRPGGILAGHDYCPAWPGVMDAINETFGTEFSVPAGRIWCHVVPE